MDVSPDLISLPRLAVGFLPVAALLVVLRQWRVGGGTPLVAVGRMAGQLAVLGFALTWLFETPRTVVLVAVLALMLAAAGWISMRPLGGERRAHWGHAILAIAAGGVTTLLIITAGVLDLDILHDLRLAVPLAGMVFSASMNSVSLSAERYAAETGRGEAPEAARNTALGAALIPLLNILLAVGIVSIPGMMTGQILAGIGPLVAARYQVMVMCMMFGAAGLSAATYLALRVRASA